MSAQIKNQLRPKKKTKKIAKNVMETKQNIVVILNPLVFMKMIG